MFLTPIVAGYNHSLLCNWRAPSCALYYLYTVMVVCCYVVF